MRWRILKTLLIKEALRHATNRGGLALAGLLITASLLLATLNPGSAGPDRDKPTMLVGGIHHCIIWYDDEDDWVKYLEDHKSPALSSNILFYQIRPKIGPNDRIKYETGTGGIEIRSAPPVEGRPKYLVYVRYPEGDRAGMAVYENWFWRESHRFFYDRAAEELRNAGINVETRFPAPILDDDMWAHRQAYRDLANEYEKLADGRASPAAVPVLEMNEQPTSGGALDMRAAIATALVLFSLCFTCIYLMPSLTCEERERGLLLAQALSPANAAEILGAKFLFYPVFGILLATLLAGIHNSAVLYRPFFWMSLVILGIGTLGIGMTIASLAKTQRAASLGALCYMLAVALVLLVCQQNNNTTIPQLALEYHAPHLLHATLTNHLEPDHWKNLAAAAALACAWTFAAVWLFRRRGWQ